MNLICRPQILLIHQKKPNQESASYHFKILTYLRQGDPQPPSNLVIDTNPPQKNKTNN